MEERLTGFVIEADAAAAIAKSAGVAAVADLLPLLVPAAQRLARPPISNYHVGAVGLGASGRIYIGVNLEFPGVPLHHSVHAEQFLIANAAVHGEAAIRCFAVSSVPCGHCRQFLQEVRGAAEIRILVTADGGAAAFRPLSYFLPHPFGPPDLLADDHPLLLEKHNNKLDYVTDESTPLRPAAAANGVGGLREAAEAAAKAAHAPYSGCAAGFALADGKGRIFAGSYMESAAYNPSLGPVQAAMVAWVTAGGGRFEGIVAAALVEGEGAAVSHEGTARVLLAAVAPLAELRVYRYWKVAGAV